MEYRSDDFAEEGLLVREADDSWGGGYRELLVYRLAHAMGVESHRLSLLLPKYELYESGSQLRRAAKSVSANLVEGYGRRRYKADYVRFLIYALSSCDETQEHLRYILECHPGLAAETEQLLRQTDTLGRKLNRFISLVEATHRT